MTLTPFVLYLKDLVRHIQNKECDPVGTPNLFMLCDSTPTHFHGVLDIVKVLTTLFRALEGKEPTCGRLAEVLWGTEAVETVMPTRSILFLYLETGHDRRDACRNGYNNTRRATTGNGNCNCRPGCEGVCST